MTSVIRFTCHKCHTHIAMPINSAGRTGKCGKCGSKLVVPVESSNLERSTQSETLTDPDQVDAGISEDTYSLSASQEMPTGSVNQSLHSEQLEEGDNSQSYGYSIPASQGRLGSLERASSEKGRSSNSAKPRLLTKQAALTERGLPAQAGVKRYIIRLTGWLWLASAFLLVQLVMLVARGNIPYVVRGLVILALCPALVLTCRKLRDDFNTLRNYQKQLKECLKNTCPNWVDDFLIESEWVQLFVPAQRLYTARNPKLGEMPTVGVVAIVDGTGQGNLLGSLLLTSKRLMFICGDSEQRSREGSWLIDTIESTYVRSQGRELVIYAAGNRFVFDSISPSGMSELALAIRSLRGQRSVQIQIGQAAEVAIDLYDATLGLIDMPGDFSRKGAVEGAMMGMVIGNPLMGAILGGIMGGKLTADQMRSRAKQALIDRGYPVNSDDQMAVLIGALRNTNPTPLINLIQRQYRPLRLAALCALRDMGPNGASALPIVRPILDDADVELRRHAMDAFTVLMEADKASNR